MVPSTQTERTEPLRRQLSVLALWLLMINGMIGAGIFGVPAAAERLAGDFSPWIFVLCALLIAPIMLCFVELSSAVREPAARCCIPRSPSDEWSAFRPAGPITWRE